MNTILGPVPCANCHQPVYLRRGLNLFADGPGYAYWYDRAPTSRYRLWGRWSRHECVARPLSNDPIELRQIRPEMAV
jgi:hypothetical protein